MEKKNGMRKKSACKVLTALVLLSLLGVGGNGAEAATYTWKGSLSGTSVTKDRTDGGTLQQNPTWQYNGTVLTFNDTDVTITSYSRSDRKTPTPTINVTDGNLNFSPSGSNNNPVYLVNTGTIFNVTNGQFTFSTTGSTSNYLGKKIAVADSEGRGSVFAINANKIDINDVVLRGAEGTFTSRKVAEREDLDGSIQMQMLAHRGWLLTDGKDNLIDPTGKVITLSGDPQTGPSMQANGLDTTIMKVDADGDVEIDLLIVQKLGKKVDAATRRWDDTAGYYNLVPIRSETQGKNVILKGLDLTDAKVEESYKDNLGNLEANALDIGNAHVKATGGNIDIASRRDPARLGKNRGVGYFMTKNGGIFLEAKKDNDAERISAGSTGNIYLLDGFVTDRAIKWKLDDQIAAEFDLNDHKKADLFVIADNDIVQDGYEQEGAAQRAYRSSTSLIVNQGTTVMAGRTVDLKGGLQNAGEVIVKAKKDDDDNSIHVRQYETVKHTVYKPYKGEKNNNDGPWNIESDDSNEKYRLDVIYGVTEAGTLRRVTQGTVNFYSRSGSESTPTHGEFIGEGEVTLDWVLMGLENDTGDPIHHTLRIESKEAAATAGNVDVELGSVAEFIGQNGTGITDSGLAYGNEAKINISLQNDLGNQGHTVAGDVLLGKYQEPSDTFQADQGYVTANYKGHVTANAGTEEGNDIIGGQLAGVYGGVIEGIAEHGKIKVNKLQASNGTVLLKAKEKITADRGGFIEGHPVFTWNEIYDSQFDWDHAGLIELESTDAKLAEMEGNIKANGGLIRVKDTNLHLGNLTGNGTTIEIHRKDSAHEGDSNYRPNEDDTDALGRYVVVDSVAGSANTFLMTISSTAKNSDFLYIKEGSSSPQTVFIKNLEGIVNELKSDRVEADPDGTKRVPFAMVFHNDGKTFNVKGKPESWQGKLVRSIVRIDKLSEEQEDKAKWKSEYHTAENGKLNWDDFKDESTSPAPVNRMLRAANLSTENVETTEGAPNFHLGDAKNANIYYIVLDSEDNKPLTDAVKRIGDNLWTLATDMDPDVDQMNGSFMGAKYFDEGKPLYEGMWARYSQDKYRPAYDSMISHTMEFGYDHAWKGNGGTRRVGMSFAHIQGSGDGVSNTTFEGMAKHHGSYRLSAIRYYDMWFGDKGHYRNFMAKAGQGLGKYDLTNDFNFFTGEIHGSFYSFGGEYGYKKELGHDVYFIPQIQVQYTHFGDDDFTTSDGLQFHNEGGNSFRTRLGFKLGREVEYDKENKDQWFLRVNWHREWMGDTGLSGVDTEGNFRSYDWERKGSWYEVGLGVNAHITKNLSGYLDFSRHYGKAAQKRYDINVGIQIRS